MLGLYIYMGKELKFLLQKCFSWYVSIDPKKIYANSLLIIKNNQNLDAKTSTIMTKIITTKHIWK